MKLQVKGHGVYVDNGGLAFNPALPSVVLIHGALHDHSVWTLLARELAQQGNSVLAVDLPGHGHSDGPPLSDVESLADWIWALLDAAGVQHAALAGHSMGSLIALEAAARQPERVSRLLLLGTAYPMKVSEALLGSARDEPLRAIDLVNSYSHAAAAPQALLDANADLMRRTLAANAGLLAHDLALCDRYATGMDAAARVTAPCTFILGEQDKMTPPKRAQALAEALGAAVLTVPAGHSLMAEAPDAVWNAVQQALTKL